MENLGDQELGVAEGAGGPPAPDDAVAAVVHERWSVKTGADPDAASIDVTKVTPTTVAALRSVAAPATVPPNGRVPDGSVETTVWALDATLVGYKLESDQDFHLGLADAKQSGDGRQNP